MKVEHTLSNMSVSGLAVLRIILIYEEALYWFRLILLPVKKLLMWYFAVS
jgi:hypothetical protein